MNKKYFYLLVFFCIAFFCLFLYLVFKGLTSAPPTPPSSSGGEEEHYEIEKEPEKGEEISKLIDKTPYFGTFFSFTYDFNTALFTVNFDPANENRGKEEFNEFLKQNGVPDMSYIESLVTTKLIPPVSATPAPL
ncbi:MAG: hypothetical protein AAB702_02010 [Patescibacteria group bacterium]